MTPVLGSRPARIGLVGCGHISGQYLTQLSRLANLELAAACDANPAAARRVADEHGVPALSLSELLADDRIDVVLNLTPPAQHAPVSQAALRAGKHVYQEKPFGISLTQARELAATAEQCDRRLGAAPDTVLGTGIQTARAAIDQGRIGDPVGATAFVVGPAMRRGIRTPGSTTSPAAAPCSTWVSTTSPHW